MPSKSKSGITEFKKFLNSKIRTWKGVDFSSNGSPVSMLQIFNVSGLDYKGQTSSGFGEKGIEINANLELELLDFIAPGLPFLSLKTGVNVKAKIAKETLIAIQRFPLEAYASRVSNIKGNGQFPQPVWSTKMPITLNTMDGKNAMVELGIDLSVSAGQEMPVPESVDELGLELSVKASASAGASINGKVISLKDSFPNSFASPDDSNLAQASALQATVDKLIGGASKQEVKLEVDAWIEGMIINWLADIEANATTSSINPSPANIKKTEKAPLTKLKTLLKKDIYPAIKDKVETKIRSSAIDHLATEIGAVFDKYIFSKIPISFDPTAAKELLEKWKSPSNNLKTKSLLTRLTDPKDGLVSVIQRSTATSDQKKAALDQCNIYINLLQRYNRTFSAESGQGQITPSYRNYLCYFELFSFAGGIGADAKVGVSGGVNVGTEKNVDAPESITNQLPDPEVKLSFVGETNLKANGEAQVLSSRFQTFSYEGGSPLVFTQDNWITYRRFDAAISVFGELGFESSEYAKQKELEASSNLKSYYSMSYISIGRYWVHPVSLGMTTKIKPTNGSGVTFGMTVSSHKLITLARTITGTLSSSSTKLLRNISQQLRIPIAKVKDFIGKLKIGDIDPAQDGFPAHVFLESSFAFPENVEMTIKKKSKTSSKRHSPIEFAQPEDAFKDPNIKEFIRKIKQEATSNPSTTGPNTLVETSLEAIRLRFRISDFDSSTKSLFQLGFPVLKSSLNIDLSSARGAGLEALFDYHVEWYNNPEFNETSSNTRAYEMSVPPVVLLHQ